MKLRLQKVIAEAGIASRRKAEILITSGQVTVNGDLVTTLGTKVDDNDKIEVNGVPIHKEQLHTYLLYKPRNVVSTVSDNKGRKTVTDFFKDLPYRLYPVGRLDYDTSGLLLMTNDGELANRLMHPKNEIEKVYVAKIRGFLTASEIYDLKHGVTIDGRKTAPAKVKIIKTDKNRNIQLVQLTIHEGHYHQVKNMFKAVNHLVEKLSRERYAFLTLKSLISGEYRELTHEEINKDRKSVV